MPEGPTCVGVVVVMSSSDSRFSTVVLPALSSPSTSTRAWKWGTEAAGVMWRRAAWCFVRRAAWGSPGVPLHPYGLLSWGQPGQGRWRRALLMCACADDVCMAPVQSPAAAHHALRLAQLPQQRQQPLRTSEAGARRQQRRSGAFAHRCTSAVIKRCDCVGR